MLRRKRSVLLSGALLVGGLLLLRQLLDDRPARSVRPWWPKGRNDSNFVIATAGCRIPVTGPADGVDAMFRQLDPAILQKRCEERKKQPQLTVLDGANVVRVVEEVRKGHGYDAGGAFHCEATPIVRDPLGADGDTYSYKNKQTATFSATYNVTADNVRVRCYHDGQPIYTDFHGAVQPKPEAERRYRQHFAGADQPYLPDAGHEPSDDHLSVVVLTLDSLSRSNFARQLPKTRRLLLDEMGAVELAGYSKVGDNTLPALHALLLGSTSDQLRWTCPLGYDDCPFVWSRYAQAGYTTVYAEDAAILHTFNYGTMGFQQQPTDYYLRPLYLAEYESEERPPWRSIDYHCFAGRPQFPVLLEWTERMLERLRQRPLFAYLHSTSTTHDDLNWAQWMDEPLHRLLDRAHRAGWLRRTALLLVSDHGMRFGGVRDTMGGRQEENLPLLTVTLPDWWRRRHRDGAFATLLANARNLVTPFDVHETLLQLLDAKFDDLTDPAPERGASLFRRLPDGRTCDDAAVPGHSCPCLTAVPYDPDSPEARLAAASVLDYVNAATAQQRHLCAKLTLRGGVRRVHQLLATAESGGHATELLVSVEAAPGGAVLEGTVRLLADGRLKEVLDVSRINSYGKQAACLSGQLPELHKYCFCDGNSTALPDGVDTTANVT